MKKDTVTIKWWKYYNTSIKGFYTRCKSSFSIVANHLSSNVLTKVVCTEIHNPDLLSVAWTNKWSVIYNPINGHDNIQRIRYRSWTAQQDYCKPEWESARKQLWRQDNRSKINSFKKKLCVNFQFNNQDRRKIKISAYNTSICKRASKY